MTLDEAAGKLAESKPRTIEGCPGYEALCPCHDDHNPSLHIWQKANGWIGVKCRSCGAGSEEVGASIGAAAKDWRWDEPSHKNGKVSEWVEPTREHHYRRADGSYAYTKLIWVDPATGKKDMRMVVRDQLTKKIVKGGYQKLPKEDKSLLYNLPEVIQAVKDGRTVHVGEGEKGADRLGAEGEVGTCQPFGAEPLTGGKPKWKPEHSKILAGSCVMVWADRDEVGEWYAAEVAHSLNEEGCLVMAVQSATLGAKDDVYDHLQAGFTVYDGIPFDAVHRPVPRKTPPEEGSTSEKSAESFELESIASQLAGRERPAICTNGRQLRVVVGDIFSAVVQGNDPPEIFVRNSDLAAVSRHDRTGRYSIRILSEADLRLAASEAADYFRVNKEGEKTECAPPERIGADLRAFWLKERRDVPFIEGVSQCPVMRKDYTFATAQGYDPETLIYLTEGPWPAYDRSLGRPLDWISGELLGEFPFDSDASFHNALALMLLPFVRRAIEGPTPLHYVGAPDPGVGKTLMVQACLAPGCGDLRFSPLSQDEEERRKKIANALLDGHPMVFFDNVKGRLDSGALAMAMTATSYTDRLIGTMGSLDVPVRCGWVMTGNNIEFDRDTRRRTVWINIDTEGEDPERRSGWKHDPLMGWALDNRASLVSACMAAIGDWREAGSPMFKGRAMGSFEQYTAIIGGILGVAGKHEFLANQDKFAERSDPVDEGYKAFFERIWGERLHREFAAGDVLHIADDVEGVARLLGDGNDRSRTTRLGRKLQELNLKVRSGLRIEKTRMLNGKQMYRLLKTDKHKDFDPYDEPPPLPEVGHDQGALPYKDD